MKTIASNRRRMTANRRIPAPRRWKLVRLQERTLAVIDAEARKWRISRGEAITRLIDRNQSANATVAANGAKESGVAA